MLGDVARHCALSPVLAPKSLSPKHIRLLKAESTALPQSRLGTFKMVRERKGTLLRGNEFQDEAIFSPSAVDEFKHLLPSIHLLALTVWRHFTPGVLLQKRRRKRKSSF